MAIFQIFNQNSCLKNLINFDIIYALQEYLNNYYFFNEELVNFIREDFIFWHVGGRESNFKQPKLF